MDLTVVNNEANLVTGDKLQVEPDFWGVVLRVAIVAGSFLIKISKGAGKVIKNFDDFVLNEKHIFSDDHIKNGIMKLGKNRQEILESIVDKVKKADEKELFKQGDNTVRTTINGYKVEIRVYIKNDKMLSLNAFPGHSSRSVSNLIIL